MTRAVGLAAALTAATVGLVYAAGAAMLLRYPFEWDPSEGGALEGAYRLLHHPGQLYPHGTVVPHPFPLPPLQALLHVPFVMAGGADLRGPRVLSALIVVAILTAMYVLVRRAGASRLLACVAAVTLLAPLGGAARLAAATVAMGLAAVGALQSATHGGFLEANRLWLLHEGQVRQLGGLFVITNAPMIAALGIVAVMARRRGERPLRDPAWALYFAGAAPPPGAACARTP